MLQGAFDINSACIYTGRVSDFPVFLEPNFFCQKPTHCTGVHNFDFAENRAKILENDLTHSQIVEVYEKMVLNNKACGLKYA